MLLALLLAAAPTDLPTLLKSLGEDAKRRESTPACAYREVTTVEELGGDAGVKGSEVRTFDVEYEKVDVTKRTAVSTEKQGAPLSDFLVQPPNAKGRKTARSPFHPDVQNQYTFGLAGDIVTIEPKKPDMERVRGTAKLDDKGHILVLDVSPSKPPLLLKSVSLRFSFADTPCGRLPIEIDMQGEGVEILIETKFQSRTLLSSHELVRKKK